MTPHNAIARVLPGVHWSAIRAMARWHGCGVVCWGRRRWLVRR